MRSPACVLLVFALAVLAGCASLGGSIEIPRQQIQAAVERRFPYEVRPAGLPLATVGVPRLELLPEQDRLRAHLAVELAPRLLREPAQAQLTLSFGLRYDGSDASLRAADVRVEQVHLQGLSAQLRPPLELAGAIVAERLLEGAVLHSLRPQDLARARGWTPGAIRVTSTGVRVQLLPPP